MKIAILDKRVRRNIALFKHLIERQAEKRKRLFQLEKKAYPAYIHRKTGELRFSQLEKKDFPKEEWKPIIIQLRPEEEGAFEVIVGDHEEYFDCDQLAPDAYCLLSKTLHILNQLSYDPKQGKNPIWVLRQLTNLDFEMTEEEEGRRSLIYEAWHNVNRLQAEHLLSGMPIGTYLFRKDEFSKNLEERLNEDFSVPILCITLTYSEWNKKISEKTLVFKDEMWLFYNNDPELAGLSYNTVKELLETMGDLLSQPLFSG